MANTWVDYLSKPPGGSPDGGAPAPNSPEDLKSLREAFFSFYDVPEATRQALRGLALGYDPASPDRGYAKLGAVYLGGGSNDATSGRKALTMAEEFAHQFDPYLADWNARNPVSKALRYAGANANPGASPLPHPDTFQRFPARLPERPLALPKELLGTRAEMERSVSSPEGYDPWNYPSEVYAKTYQASGGRLPPPLSGFYQGLLSEDGASLLGQTSPQWGPDMTPGRGYAFSQFVRTPEGRAFVAKQNQNWVDFLVNLLQAVRG